MNHGCFPATTFLAALLMAGPVSAQGSDALARHSPPRFEAKDYQRVARLLDAAEHSPIRNAAIVPHWIGDGDRFWYRKETADGAVFILVDVRTTARSPAFDHQHVATALGHASAKPVSPDNLPFSAFRFTSDGKSIAFDAFDTAWQCALDEPDCVTIAAPPAYPKNHAVAPDERHAIFRRDRNLWIKTDGGAERALTQDGIQYNEYGYVSGDLQGYVASENIPGGVRPSLSWSPDSTKFLTHRIDETKVGERILWQGAPDGSRRAKATVFRQSQVGDDHFPITTYMIFDTATGKRIDVKNIPADMMVDPVGGFGAVLTEWAPDSRSVYVLARDRHYRRVGLFRIDAATGEARLVLEETSPTFVSLNGRYDSVGHGVTLKLIDQGRQLLWFSERDGWGHLYRYDIATGALLNQVTSGPWVVTDIVEFDEQKGIIYFLGAGREAGRNPYLKGLYRINLDGSDLRLLTPEPFDHDVSATATPVQLWPKTAETTFSSDKAYFVDRYGGVDTVTTSVLRSSDTGKVLMTIEEADFSALGDGCWIRPVPFVVKARDGKTDIFGTMYLPADFDRTKKYPVIDNVYPGAHAIGPDVRSFSPFYFYRQALANLGFIIVNLDGFGTTGRGKAFHDLSYGNLQDGPGLPDHVVGIQELARTYPQIDLDRVGVYGHSSGGYGTVLAMLKFPDFYKVGVASAAAVDMCGAIPLMMDKWQGPPTPGKDYCEPVFLANMAANLKGKLLLAYGEMDEHMPASTTVGLIDALTRANRDYDLIVMPNLPHGFMFDRYFTRRLFDYFVRHLLGSEPPPNATLSDPER
ncbi:S9 family peptidase [Sphingosinicella rhizophila]|uniref:DPP IV N-terminal domain-containing protein n=1 Tax=Sphingosinicella rhizophila TaxID=3050082 RepID=A0ABU3Q5R7_9SPHN|nr:DPP IV N-terminal domain-containing protein [Sphingosinicella sp. GR2756]MDT9598754.1 DPP IV N-terminal domain-containing protein [Sphingosinicella sp. GR2756]